MITAKYGLWFLFSLDPDGKKDFDIALTDRMEKEFFFFLISVSVKSVKGSRDAIIAIG